MKRMRMPGKETAVIYEDTGYSHSRIKIMKLKMNRNRQREERSSSLFPVYVL